MASIEMVGAGGSDNWPQDGGGPGGQFHAAEELNHLRSANGMGVDGHTFTMTVTGLDRIVTLPAFNYWCPDGSGGRQLVVFAGGAITIAAADGTDPRTDYIKGDVNGTVDATSGVATEETGDVEEAPMTIQASDEVIFVKVRSEANVATIGTDKVFGRAIDVSENRQRESVTMLLGADF